LHGLLLLRMLLLRVDALIVLLPLIVVGPVAFAAVAAVAAVVQLLVLLHLLALLCPLLCWERGLHHRCRWTHILRAG
jgi:hypothetical protein